MKSKKPRIPPAPRGLSDEGKRLWKMVNQAYELDGPSLELLLRALETLATVRAAEAQLEADGLTFKDDREVIRPHPAAGILRDHRSLFLRYWKSLNLDLEPLHDRPGRPAGGR